MKLPREFYCRDTLTVARELLGMHLVHDSVEGRTTGKIVEVEAYKGPGDAAAHSYRGIRSSRTRIQYGPGGYAYIFIIYGMYYCFNIVASVEERPEVVLVRALEPVEGIDLMKERRKTERIVNLCNGPGKLCAAMGITAGHYGADLCGAELYLTTGEDVDDAAVEATTRINIDYAGEARNYPWRYIIKGSRFVSKP
ncbi:MAG: DNA-3-methyladenine glycosylase [Bacillota bacterium]